MTLYCFPFAGGNAWSYRPLQAKLSPRVTVDGLELPGRGRRSAEPLCPSLEQLADDLVAQLRPRLSAEPFAFYGHSMGALLALLTARRLREHGLPQPGVLIVSGSDAPSVMPERRRHLLPPAEFVAMLQELGGCPPQVLEDRELLAFFEPILRADFQAVETWDRRAEAPLAAPIVALIGADDETSAEGARAWAGETGAACETHEYPGGHFFILDHWDALARLIEEQLARAASVVAAGTEVPGSSGSGAPGSSAWV
ncbi:MAG: thioesterase II family protein [Vicinamibacterales bacterium]